MKAATQVLEQASSEWRYPSVQTIGDYQSFLELAPLWNQLVEESGVDHPFLTHEWVSTWWQCFGAGKQLHIVVVREGSKVVAIAPLMITEGKMYGLKVRCLEFISNVHTPRCDFLLAPEGERHYSTIWSSVLRDTSCWDILRLCQVPPGSCTLKELPHLARRQGFLTGLWRSANSPYVPVQGSWNQYFKALDRKHRSNLGNRWRRLQALGMAELEVVTGGPRLDEALEEGLRIEASGWKGKAGTAIACRPDVRRFYSELAHRAAERGWLRLQFLSVGGRPIAFHYALCYAKSFFLVKPGYDPDYARYSPSHLLCWLALQEAFSQGLREYDFLGVADEWKLEWTRHTRAHYWLFVFRNTLPSRLLHWVKFRALPWVKKKSNGGWVPCTFRPGQF